MKASRSDALRGNRLVDSLSKATHYSSIAMPEASFLGLDFGWHPIIRVHRLAAIVPF
jgi:hypothetical protein